MLKTCEGFFSFFLNRKMTKTHWGSVNESPNQQAELMMATKSYLYKSLRLTRS